MFYLIKATVVVSITLYSSPCVRIAFSVFICLFLILSRFLFTCLRVKPFHITRAVT